MLAASLAAYKTTFMKLANSRIDGLKEMLALEEERTKLQAQLDSIAQRMSQLKDVIFNAKATAPSGAAPAPARGPGRPPGSGRRGGRGRAGGTMRDKVLAALESAGASGVRVTELAAALGTKAANVYSWFHANLKNHPEIKKVSGGEYRLAAGAKTSPASAPVAKAASPAKGKPGRKRAARAGRRGALKEQILAILKSAGPGGIKTSEIAQKIGANPKNVAIWFSTTGKKTPGIKKSAPATFRYSG
jgi:hypothetical protein